MSQIGLKALKVLGGAERPTDSTAQLSEAWLTKIKKINQVADNMDSNNGVVKKKPTSNRKPQTQSAPMMEQKERQVPITEILARTKTEKIGLNKTPVSPDAIKALLTGQKPQAAMPVVENRRIETQYEEFIKEAKSYQKENIIDEYYEKPSMMNENTDIRNLVNEEVNRILFNEIFSKNRLRSLMESVFQDVIKEKAKEILFETLKRKKAQGF
jgi:hypothetical protein